MNTWTKDAQGESFAGGLLCWDRDAKETVRVSNGTCIHPHSTAEYDGHMAEGGCVYAPSEAIAVRVIGWKRTKKGSRPVVAYTYRGVRAESLSVLKMADQDSADRANRFPWPEDAQFISGRV